MLRDIEEYDMKADDDSDNVAEPETKKRKLNAIPTAKVYSFMLFCWFSSFKGSGNHQEKLEALLWYSVAQCRQGELFL